MRIRALCSGTYPLPVNKMVVWVRLFHAAHLLAEPGRTVEGVAFALGYPSVNAFRNKLHRYAGVAPSELRGGSGAALLLDIFRERHRAGRWTLSGKPGERPKEVLPESCAGA